MKTEIMLVTPELAEKWLSYNTGNRSVSDARVTFYSQELIQSRWQLNGESIKFDTDGRLLDGQHRLMAVIKSGVSLKTFVVHGLPTSVFTTIDTGKGRTGRDALKINSVENATNISTGIKRFLILKTGFTKQRRVSNSEVIDEYNSRPEYYQSLFCRGQQFYNSNHRILSPGDYIGFYAWFHETYSEDKVDGFFKNIEDSVGVCGLLYNRLLDDVISKKKLIRVEKTAIIIKAFKFYLSGNPIKLLKFAVDEPFPTLTTNLTELMSK